MRETDRDVMVERFCATHRGIMRLRTRRQDLNHNLLFQNEAQKERSNGPPVWMPSGSRFSMLHTCVQLSP